MTISSIKIKHGFLIVDCSFLPVLALGPLRDVARALVADAAAEHQLPVLAFGALLERAEHHRVRQAVQNLKIYFMILME